MCKTRRKALDKIVSTDRQMDSHSDSSISPPPLRCGGYNEQLKEDKIVGLSMIRLGVFSSLTSAEACEKSSRWLWKEKLC